MGATALFAEASDGRWYRQQCQDNKEEADHLIPKDMDRTRNPRQDVER